LGHPSHSPNLAPSDYHLFGKLNEHIKGKKFGDDNEAKDEVLRWLNEKVAAFTTQASRSLSLHTRNALRNMVTMYKNK
jgi:hypothetical protein